MAVLFWALEEIAYVKIGGVLAQNMSFVTQIYRDPFFFKI
jgi:hypothetical protein